MTNFSSNKSILRYVFFIMSFYIHIIAPLSDSWSHVHYFCSYFRYFTSSCSFSLRDSMPLSVKQIMK